jgi:F-type H+-transporting ATPase subunit gamma
VITVGRRGRAFARYTGLNVRDSFQGISDAPTLRDTLPISRLIIDEYTRNETDQVFLAYPTFVSTVNQRPTLDLILPIEPAKTTSLSTEYIYEPNAKTVLDELLPRFVEMRVYHAILELIASEQASRMVAMRNASDNARSVIEGLTLTLNKVRQETITKEICDISGGAEAFNK